MPGIFIRTSRRNKILTNLSHYLIGLAILTKGYAKLEHHPDQIIKILFIFFAGIFIILGAAFHHKIEKKIKNFTSLFYIAEGAALIFIGLIYLEEGSARVSYFLSGLFILPSESPSFLPKRKIKNWFKTACNCGLESPFLQLV